MYRSLYLLLVLFVSAALLTTGCKKNSDNPVDGDDTVSDITIGPFINAMALSPDGKLLAVYSSSGMNPQLVIYNTQNNTVLRTLATGNLYVSRLAFSQDGSVLLASTNVNSGMNARVWNTTTWQELRSFSNIQDAFLAPDAASIFAVEKSTLNVVRYSIATGDELARFDVWLSNDPQNRIIQLIGLCGNGTQLLYSSTNELTTGPLRVWDMAGNNSAKAYGEHGYLTYFQLSAIGSHLLIQDRAYHIRFFDTNRGEELYMIAPDIYAVFALSPDGTQYVTNISKGTNTTAPALYKFGTDTQLQLLPAPTSQPSFSSFAYSGNGSVLAGAYYQAGVYAYKIRIWNLR